MVNGQVQYSANPIHLLLGLIHGHFDVGTSSVDVEADAASSAAQINTGMAIVVPYYKIREVLDQPMLLEWRAQLAARLRGQPGR